MPTPRRLAACLAALATSLSLATLVPAAAVAASGDRPAVRITSVSGYSEPTPHGTSVSASFVVTNHGAKRRAARTTYLSLVDVDRDRGPQRAYRLAHVRTPALAPGGSAAVEVVAEAPRATTSGEYHLRVCSTPRAGAGRCTLSRRAVVPVGPALLTTNTPFLEFDSTGAGESSEPQDLLVANEGQSRTNRVRLALSGPDADDFSVDPGTCLAWLAPGESCTAQVTFAPGVDAPASPAASLRVGGSGRGGDFDLELTGSVPREDQLSVSPAAWDYGDVPVGGSATHTFRFVNDGDTDASLTDGRLDSTEHFDFDYVDGQNSCLEGVIPAHGSCTFSVAFMPRAAGPLATDVTFSADSGSGTSQLSGTGVDLGPGRLAPRPAAPGGLSTGLGVGGFARG